MNITALKEVLKRVRELFKTDKSSISAVFFDKPRILIWFLVSYFVMVSRYVRSSTVYPLFSFMMMSIVLFSYIIFIYFVSSNIAEKILRYANSVRRISTRTEKERLIPIFKEVYSRAFRNNRIIGRKIKPYIVDSIEINAFIIGRNTLVITRGAIETFNDEELKGIIAHEFGHLNNFDGQIALLIKFCTTIFLWIFIAVSLIFKLLEKSFENSFIGDLFGMVRQLLEGVVKFVLFIWTLIISGGSRRKEYNADMYAKSI